MKKKYYLAIVAIILSCNFLIANESFEKQHNNDNQKDKNYLIDKSKNSNNNNDTNINDKSKTLNEDLDTANKKDTPVGTIEQELSQAEKDFQIAKKMFNPWYGGPLLTGSGNVFDPGYININPVLQVTNNYANFNKNRKSKSAPDLINVNPSLFLGIGVINRLETAVTIQTIYQHQSSESYHNFGDTSWKIGIGILKEKPYIPAFKLTIKEIFPTGKYKNLDPNKANVQGLGGGSYKTEVALNLSKVFWWSLTHPMQFRLALSYGMPTDVSVKNFNSYGGGFGTNGKVTPGNYLLSSLGYELSFTQKFVFAIDLSYEYYNKQTFRGINGTTVDGLIAANNAPSKDVLSLAPALEYNFTPDIALIVGAWFSVWGRNTSNFVAGIVNFSYGF